MSGNDNFPDGSIVRQLRGRSVVIPNPTNNGSGSNLQGNGQAASDGFLPAQHFQPSMIPQQSGSNALSLPQTTIGLGIDLHGMYSSTQSHALSHGFSFSNMAQPVSGFAQEQLYSTSNNLFQMASSGFDIVPSGDSEVFGYTLNDLKIKVGVPKPEDSQKARKDALDRLKYHLENPPLLPENTVSEVQPKTVFPDFIKLPEDATKAEKRAAEKINHGIATESQKVDRERNNEAAKRSRRLKNENLENANKRLVENTLRIAWLEAQVIAMGGRPQAFDSIDPNIKHHLHCMIIDNRNSSYERRKRKKSKQDTKKRHEHNKRRAAQKRALNERTAHQYAQADLAETIEDTKAVAVDVSGGIAANDAPGIAANDAPGIAANDAPGIAANDAPGIAANVAPGIAANDAPGIAANVAPGIAANDAPGIAANVAPAITANVAAGISADVAARSVMNSALNVLDPALGDDGGIFGRYRIAQPATVQPSRQPRGQGDEPDDAVPPFSVVGALNESFMLMEDENDWDHSLA